VELSHVMCRSRKLYAGQKAFLAIDCLRRLKSRKTIFQNGRLSLKTRDMPRDDDEVSLISDISTLLVSDAFLSEDARKTKKHIRHIFKLGLACTLVVFFPVTRIKFNNK
jgi:hypothetical protein